LYGANSIQPYSLVSADSNTVLGNPMQLSSAEKAKCDLMKEFMNGQFKTSTEITSSGIKNTPDDAEHLQTFLRQMQGDVAGGLYNAPWGVPMTGDMFNIYSGIKIMQEFKPELMVINMQDIDIGHFDFTKYANNIRMADFALYKLWEAIQATPGMANDTVLIVAPEHGRNQLPNSVVDAYGRYALDHNNDAMSREIFCLVVGPSGIVKQNQVITTVQGESVDVVPTIANLLGFDADMPTGIMDGRVLTEAFN
jgi:hypothetical protein